MADPPGLPEGDSKKDEGDSKKDSKLFNVVIGIISLAAAVFGLTIKSPGTPTVRLSVFAAILLGAFVLTILSRSRWTIKAAALLLAIAAAATTLAAMQEVTVSPGLGPQIKITAPIDGGWVSSHPIIKGTATPLGRGQEIFSFNEPFTTDPLARPGGQAFPDSGPCQSAGRTFACDEDFVGAPEADYCQKFYLWVAIVTINEGNYYNNVKSGTADNNGLTYVALRTGNSPGHIGAAIDRIEVQRYPSSRKEC